ncbi:MAG: hypothetical protein ACPGOY_07785 [Rhodospirillaceae bacterium]
MLTMDEIVGTQSVQFSQRLDDISGDVLDTLLRDDRALTALLPPNMELAEARSEVRAVIEERRQAALRAAAEAKAVAKAKQKALQEVENAQVSITQAAAPLFSFWHTMLRYT